MGISSIVEGCCQTILVCADILSSEYFVYITNGTEFDGDGSVVDVSDAGYGDVLHPFLRLKGGVGVDAFCVLNSQLYWFDGCEPKENYCYYYDYDDDDDASRRSAHKLDLLELSSRGGCGGDLVLEKSGTYDGVQKLLDMTHSKCNPTAIVSPDGKKIMVFSRRPRSLNGFVYDFELFDVDQHSWTTLPALSASCHMYFILSHGFQTNSIFLVSLGSPCGGSCGDNIFSLDIGNREDGWKSFRHISVISGVHDGPFCVIDESLFLTYCAIGRCEEDIKKRDKVVGVPLPSLDDFCEVAVFGSMLVRNVKEEKERTFCNLSVGKFVGGRFLEGYPVDMNVIKFDTTALPTPSPTILNRLKYTLIAPPAILYFLNVATLG